MKAVIGPAWNPVITPRRRLPAGDQVAALFVAVAVLAGVLLGRTSTGPFSCGHQDVSVVAVGAQNFLLSLILMSGLFTAGLGTVLLGGALLFYTGITVGVGMAQYGGAALLLLAPHGALELAAWTLFVSVGLLPLTTREATVSLLPMTIRRAALGAGSLILAAPLEYVWTVHYGPSVVC